MVGPLRSVRAGNGQPVILQEKTNGATNSYLYGLDLVSATG